MTIRNTRRIAFLTSLFVVAVISIIATDRHDPAAADLGASAQAVKDSFAVPTQPDGFDTHSRAVDWAGADWSRFDAVGVSAMLTTLDQLTTPAQRTSLFRPAAVTSDTKPGYSTQQQIAALQMIHVNATKARPKAIAILEFGVWLKAFAQDVRRYPFQIPQTFDLDQRLATSVTVKK